MRLLRRLFALSVLLAALILIAPHTTSTAQTPQPVEPPPHVYPPDLKAPPQVPGSQNLPEGVPLPPSPTADQQIQAGYPDFASWLYVAYQVYSPTADAWDIHMLLPGQTTRTVITDDQETDIDPDLRIATGELLYAAEYRGYYVIVHMKDGVYRSLTSFTFDSYQPAWSPDGARIAFVTNRDGNEEIYVMNVDGSGQTRLTSDSRSDFSPTWSPDGKYLIWVRAIDQQTGVIMRMNASGANPVLVQPGLRYATNVAYSPKGDKIAFDYDANGDGWMDWGVLNLEQGDITVLLNGETYSGSDGYLHGNDYYVGSWATNDILVGDAVGFIYYYGDWYWYGSSAVTSDPYRGIPYLEGYSLSHDVASKDPYPPNTRVNPMPMYSRTGDIASIDGGDPGPSGLCAVKMYWREGENGEWQEDRAAIDLTYLTYRIDYHVPGSTLYLKSASSDCAENYEDFPLDYDTVTRMYRDLFAGKVFDIRDAPLTNVSVNQDISFPNAIPAWDEPNTDASGSFARYINSAPYQGYSFTIDYPGYTSLPLMYFKGDATFNWFIPPTDDRVLNGGFETASDWTLSGSVPPQRSATAAHTGSNGLKLGSLFLTSPIDLSPDLDGTSAKVILDSAGAKVLTWVRAGQVFFSRKPEGEAWSAPLRLDADAVDSICPAVAAGSDGSVHMAWFDFQSSTGNDTLQYARVASDNSVQSGPSISGPFNIITSSVGACPKMVVDSTGTVHVTWYGSNQTGTYALWYSNLPAGGSWSAPENIGVESWPVKALLIDPSDRLYVTVRQNNTNVIKRRKNGVWDTSIALPGHDTIDVAVDSTGRIYALDEGTGGERVMIRSINLDEGIWSSPTDLLPENSLGSPVALRIGTDDTIHVIFSCSLSTHTYRTFTPGKGWSLPAILDINKNSEHSLFPADQGLLLYTDYTSPDNDLGVRSVTFPQSYDSIASQTVSIPADMQNPTLSFLYKLTASAGAETLHVLANGTEIFNTNKATADWTHKWLDLTSYAGQDVTLDFRVEVPSSQKEVSLLLDEVSLGSWKTPWLKAVSPGRILSGWAGKVLTIDLENYVAGSTLYLDDTALTNVQVVDADTVTAVIPADLPPGGYHLRIETPDGLQSELPQDVYLGTSNWIPIIIRE